jgi:hypothetical protein
MDGTMLRMKSLSLLMSTFLLLGSMGAGELVDPATLKQFDDDRVFFVNGRKCVGSELNGQRNDDPDERRFTSGNRVINPHPLRADRPLEWELRDATAVYDGAGVHMGDVAAKLTLDDGRRVASSKFNFGMSKIIDGKQCIYAFGVSIKPTTELAKIVDPKEMKDGVVGTSAWLPLEQVVEKDELSQRIGLNKPALPHLPLEEKSYQITGGDPRAYMTESGELSIIANVAFGAVPSHYLRRPSGTVNLLYCVPGFSLGGQGVDAFLVSDRVVFRPAKGARIFVQPTYFPAKHAQAGKKSDKTMTFIYGAVQVKGQEDVYGWIAKEALSPQN